MLPMMSFLSIRARLLMIRSKYISDLPIRPPTLPGYPQVGPQRELRYRDHSHDAVALAIPDLNATSVIGRPRTLRRTFPVGMSRLKPRSPPRRSGSAGPGSVGLRLHSDRGTAGSAARGPRGPAGAETPAAGARPRRTVPARTPLPRRPPEPPGRVTDAPAARRASATGRKPLREKTQQNGGDCAQREERGRDHPCPLSEDQARARRSAPRLLKRAPRTPTPTSDMLCRRSCGPRASPGRSQRSPRPRTGTRTTRGSRSRVPDRPPSGR